MPLILGGPGALVRRAYGEFNFSIQYLNDEPAMFFWLTRKSKGNPAFVIRFEDAYLYREDRDSMEDHNMRVYRIENLVRPSIRRSLIAIGVHEPTTAQENKIITIINSHMDAFLAMPPAPSPEKLGEKMVERGSIVIRDGGKEVAEHPIRIPLAEAVAGTLH